MSTEAPRSPCGLPHTYSLGCFRPPHSGVSGPPAPATLGCFRPPAEPCPCRTRSPPPPAPTPSPRAATPRLGVPQVRAGQGRGQAGGACLALALRGEFPLRGGFARFWRRSRVSGCQFPAVAVWGPLRTAAPRVPPAVAGLSGEGRAVVSARLTCSPAARAPGTAARVPPGAVGRARIDGGLCFPRWKRPRLAGSWTVSWAACPWAGAVSFPP